MAYVLFLDGKATTVHKTLQDAQAAAKPHIDRKMPVTIESMVAPAPSEIWYYDHDLPGWVRRQ